ncbi:MAG: hypothetical protein ACRCV0_00980 [Brevinema sp.]
MSYTTYHTEINILGNIASDKRFIDYSLARKFVEIELALLNHKEQKWINTTLVELPIVIYDYKKEPVYYEFRIQNQDNKTVGAITLHIDKSKGFPQVFEIDYPQCLEKINKTFPHFALIDCGYPIVGYCEDLKEESLKIHYFESDSEEIQVKDHDPDPTNDLKFLGLDTNNYSNESARHTKINNTDVKSFWEYIEDHRNAILNNSIKVDPLTTTVSEKVSADYDQHWNWIVEYADSIYGWCGPSLMTWFVSVVGKIKDKSTSGIRDLYKSIEKIIGTGPVIAPGLNKIFKTPSSPFATLPYRISELPLFSFQTQKIMDHMKKNRMPIGSLINYLTIGKGWGSWHWRGVFEIEKISPVEKYKSCFSWWKWRPSCDKNNFQYRYTLFDNGYTLSEKPSYTDKYHIEAYKGKHFFREHGNIPCVYFFPFVRKI